MEGNKPVYDSASSLTSQLFGAIESSPSSKGHFASIFPPPSMVHPGKDSNSSFLYYGRQEIFQSASTTQNSGLYNVFSKKLEEDDPNASNSQSASRGNWWQGSLYY